MIGLFIIQNHVFYYYVIEIHIIYVHDEKYGRKIRC